MNEILEIIEQDPKKDPAEIALLTGYSEDEVRSRIKELEDNGIIRKYKAVIDWDKVGEEYIYAVIELKINLGDRTGYDTIAQRIASFNEVRSIRLISGDHDLSLTVRGHSMKDVAFFVAEKISTLDQVQNTVTHFVLKTYKEDGVTLFEKDKSKRLAISF
ncbi:MAG: winged helix-turn-helix transcriptional regulator [Nitrospirae bacterium]|nr:winged helix-turn-helix transcriptional regulator [Nitrospirota bacterium]